MPDIICIQETWIYDDSLPYIKGYSSVHDFRTSKKGGGSAIYVKDNINYNIIKKIKFEDIEIEAVGIKFMCGNNELITLLSVYIAPSQILKEEHLNKLLVANKLMIVGDLNAKSPLWGSPIRDVRGKLVEKFLEDNNLSCLNSGEGTRFNERGPLSHLDIVISNSNMGVNISCEVGKDRMGSDHYPLILEYETSVNKIELGLNSRYCYKRANWLKFKNCLENDLTLKSPVIDAEEAYNRLQIAYKTARGQSIPHINGPFKHKYSPFWNVQCSAAKKVRKEAEKDLRKTNSIENLIKYKKAKLAFKNTFARYKRIYWENYCAGLNYNSKTANVWKTIRKLKGKNVSTNISCITDGNELVDNKKLAENFSKIFEEISSDKGIGQELLNYRKQTVELFLKTRAVDEHSEFITQKNDAKIVNKPFTIMELDQVLQLVNCNSAPGADEIPYSFITNSPKSTKLFFLDLINNSWSTGNIPSGLKHSIIKPILKPRKEKSDLNSYRPISLTSTISKVMEKMVGSRLNWFLEKNNLINPRQAGFRKHFGTGDPIIRIKQEAELAINSGYFTVAILIDFRRAFDLLWVDGLIMKLIKLKLTGNFIKWIKSFLTGRSCQVRVNDTLSSCYYTENGTPQGSALSPILFIVMINDFPQLSSYTSDGFFADDCTIWRSGKNLTQIIFHLQQDIDLICSWCKRWGFVINTEKTTGIVFTKNNLNLDKIVIKIDGKPICFNDKCVLLGVTFDRRMTWNAHIEALEDKAKSNLNLMRCISGTKWGANRNILMTVYKALIRSHLDYCSFVYNDCSKTLKGKVDSIQYKSLLIAVGGIKGTALYALLGECGETSLELRRKKLLIKYLLKLQNNKNNAASTVLIDKKYFNLEINNKSNYKQILDNFTSANDIVLEKFEYASDPEPWTENYEQVDIELSQINNVQNKTQDAVNKYSLIKNTFKNIFLVDGSVKKDGKVGAAVFCADLSLKLHFKLPVFLNIYYAEAFAILKALEFISEHDLQKSCIISDSLTVLSDIKYNHLANSPHPYLINTITKHLSGLKSISISWLPGHLENANIPSADKIAKLSADLPYPPVNISYTCAEATCVLEEWVEGLWNNEWRENIKCSYQKIFKLNKGHEFTFKSRRIDTAISRLRLCQTRLNSGKFKIGQHEDGLCLSCGVMEDGYHFIFNCVRTVNLRIKLREIAEKGNVKWNFADVLSNKESIIAIAEYIVRNNIEV